MPRGGRIVGLPQGKARRHLEDEFDFDRQLGHDRLGHDASLLAASYAVIAHAAMALLTLVQ